MKIISSGQGMMEVVVVEGAVDYERQLMVEVVTNGKWV